MLFNSLRKTVFVILLGFFTAYTVFAAGGSSTLLPQVGPQAATPAANLTEPESQTRQSLELKDMLGEVLIQKKGASNPVPVQQSIKLEMGDWIFCKEGSAKLYLGNQSYLTIYPNTDMRITEASLNQAQNSTQTEIQLQTGRLKIKVNKLHTGSRFEVRTPVAVAAVRGTLFYIHAGVDGGTHFTELYVDESGDGVQFIHLKNLLNFLVPNFSSSYASEDGTLLAPRRLAPVEQKDLKDNWEKILEKIAQQFGVETLPLPGSAPPNDLPNSNLTSNTGVLTNDAVTDKKNEQNVFGQDQFGSQEGTFSGQPDEENPGDDEIIAEYEDLAQQASSDYINFNYSLSQISRISIEDMLELLRRSVGFYFIRAEHGDEEGFEWSYDSVNQYKDYGVVSNDYAAILSDLGIDVDSGEVSSPLESEELAAKLTDLAGKLNELLSLAGPIQNAEDKAAILQQAQQLVDELNLGIEEVNQILAQFEVAVDTAMQNVEALRAQERNEMRQEIARIRGDIEFEQADAALEKIADAQTGKVFTDIHGNRVRVDQYIYHEADSNALEILSLTLRKGDYQPGVSSIHVGVEFNQPIPSGQELRSLPWNDYFNVVTSAEIQARLPQEGNWSSQEALAPQYIVHESQPDLAASEGGFYPTHFFAEFSNPQQNQIRMDEAYGAPHSLILGGEGQGTFLWVQPLIAQSTLIVPGSQQEPFLIIQRFSPETEIQGYRNATLVYDKQNFEDFDKTLLAGTGEQLFNFDAGFDSASQTFGFASTYQPGDFVNIDFNSEDPEGPATRLMAFVYMDQNENMVQYGVLQGFIPFDNNGSVIDAPGFRIDGIRDMFRPNVLVNGGDYNLEILTLFVGFDGNSINEIFRIDTIVTPEIFSSGSGFDTRRDTEQFPSTLDNQD